MRDPLGVLSAPLKALHEGVEAGSELVLDVRELTYVSSAGLRLLLDWALWVAQMDEGAPLRPRLPEQR